MEMKLCNKCEEESPVDTFPTKNGKPRSYCAACNRKASLEAWRKRKSQPGYAEYAKAKDRKRLLAKYGLTPEEFDSMVLEQGNKCAICGVEMLKEQCVDHDHTTGVTRKLLCFHCNVGLGHFKDDVNLLVAAQEYLVLHSVWAEPQKFLKP